MTAATTEQALLRRALVLAKRERDTALEELNHRSTPGRSEVPTPCKGHPAPERRPAWRTAEEAASPHLAAPAPSVVERRWPPDAAEEDGLDQGRDEGGIPRGRSGAPVPSTVELGRVPGHPSLQRRPRAVASTPAFGVGVAQWTPHRGPAGETRQRRRADRVTCFRCHERGHRVAECPRRRRPSQPAAPAAEN